jgi:hypothetical protein
LSYPVILVAAARVDLDLGEQSAKQPAAAAA